MIYLLDLNYTLVANSAPHGTSQKRMETEFYRQWLHATLGISSVWVNGTGKVLRDHRRLLRELLMVPPQPALIFSSYLL